MDKNMNNKRMKDHIVARWYFGLTLAGLVSAFIGISQVEGCNFPGSYMVEPEGWCAIPNGTFMAIFLVCVMAAAILLVVTSGVLSEKDK